MTDLTLFHTADVHVATFDALAPEADLTHVVRTDWLERAQTGVDAALRQEIAEAIRAAEGPSLCTCTTIGAGLGPFKPVGAHHMRQIGLGCQGIECRHMPVGRVA